MSDLEPTPQAMALVEAILDYLSLDLEQSSVLGNASREGLARLIDEQLQLPKLYALQSRAEVMRKEQKKFFKAPYGSWDKKEAQARSMDAERHTDRLLLELREHMLSQMTLMPEATDVR